MDWALEIRNVEDHLVPTLQLDPWERVLYYHLLRHTRVGGTESALFSIGGVASSSGLSTTKVRDALRSMDRKGCLSIEQRTRKGHLVRVLLPSEISGLIPEPTLDERVDFESLDFFRNRQHVGALLQREAGQCFYCLREVSIDSCELDHVVPQAEVLDNSYRNIVVSCHECNTTKQGRPGDEFVRGLYRSSLLSRSEFEGRLKALQALQAGRLRPKV